MRPQHLGEEEVMVREVGMVERLQDQTWWAHLRFGAEGTERRA
eukprot:CAMPEP_0185900574 /NCGR_PEP_ID=MMETSP0196C-20130402/99_1 /TAXON_ID=2932 /ORGANISM="Alexandrium fundyense, Strain CCMP1719" /LENGTH=42 /DNA_ID= /DNA_START= /DNA_END= /DNA_ORIENTATION=